MKLSIQQQADIVNHVKDSFTDYEMRLNRWHSNMATIYEKVRSFTQKKRNKRDTNFKVNKAHEIENKVMPKIVANDPKWIVSHKDIGSIEKDEEFNKNMTTAIRDYLHFVFKQQDVKESVRLLGKNMIRYGLGFGKVDYKYSIARDAKKKEVTEVDEEGNEYTSVSKQINEGIANEYPCVNIVPVTDMYFDPRYLRLEDMPGLIQVKRRVRLSSFTMNKKKYMNVDNIIEAVKMANEDPNGFRSWILGVTGIGVDADAISESKTLDVKCFYGLYDISDKKDQSNEKLYEFWTINDVFLVYAKEITAIPYEDARCFEDTDTFLSTGIIEPILSLQDELNFKKNAGATYINQGLYRSWFWSPQSGINPKKLNNAHGNIIPTSKDRNSVEQGLWEVPHRQIPGEFFQEQNDFERQIQALSYTIDTGNPTSQQALTNTATGAKIKAFESNAVMAEIRKHLEESLARLAYKLLQVTLDNLESNISIKKLDSEGFWELNKEAFRDAINKYDIEVEAGSSSYDSEEKRRNDAVARWNLYLQAMQAGLPVDMKKGFTDVMNTFEKVDASELFKKEIPQLPGIGVGPGDVSKLPKNPLPANEIGGIGQL